MCVEGKDDYLTDEKEEPSKDYPKNKSWKSGNNMIMSWLVNSMEKDIGHTFLYYWTAKKIWDVVKKPT